MGLWQHWRTINIRKSQFLLLDNHKTRQTEIVEKEAGGNDDA